MAQKTTAKKTPLSTRMMGRKAKSGVTLIVVTCSLVFLVPMAGLAIDVGLLYAVKSRLQAAVDGAALGAARALSIGQDLGSQTLSAQNNAVNWFNANFPSGSFFTTNTVMGTSNVTVANDPNNAQLRNVSVTATTRVSTIFMKWFNIPNTLVGATGTASRRTVVAMLVLDRSGSMCTIGSTRHDPCKAGDSSWSGTPCATMLSASKTFTGQFANRSDYMGLVSFSSTSYIHSAPTQDFQTTLGYTNSSGTGTGAIDTLQCYGWTSTAQAISMAYQLIAQTNLPGALNVIVLETDGLPNALAVNLWDVNTSTTGLSNSSNCTDKAGKKMNASGFRTAASIWAYTNGIDMTKAPFLTNNHGPYTTIPAEMVGMVASDDPGNGNKFDFMSQYWSNTSSTPASQSQGTANYYNSFQATTVPNSHGCNFNSPTASTNESDIAWWPATDVFGNAVNPANHPYKSVTTDSNGHLTANGWTNFHSGAINATDNAAYRARANTANVNVGNVSMFVIGLGGNTGSTAAALDPVLLQRMANDPAADSFNNPSTYPVCAQANFGCYTFPSPQPQGTFIYAPDTTSLGAAFLRISSQVLRLSH